MQIRLGDTIHRISLNIYIKSLNTATLYCLHFCVSKIRQAEDTTFLQGKQPEMTYRSISHYFLDRLSVWELQKLEKIAKGLSGKVVTFASTCSGIASAGPCIQGLLKAINDRFQTNVRASCQFACEINPQKQKLLLDLHQDDIGHLFADVKSLQHETAFCLREQRQVKVPKVFLLIASPSCINLSGQRVDRASYASCYEDPGNSESGETYVHGYRDALQSLEAKVSAFENVKDVAHYLTDKNNVRQKPAIETVRQDPGG